MNCLKVAWCIVVARLKQPFRNGRISTPYNVDQLFINNISEAERTVMAHAESAENFAKVCNLRKPSCSSSMQSFQSLYMPPKFEGSSITPQLLGHSK